MRPAFFYFANLYKWKNRYGIIETIAAEKMKNEERKHEQYKKEYGEFIGNILYLNDLKGV